MYINIIKWWLTALLMFFPFQYKMVNFIRPFHVLLANTLSRLDEITIIICIVPAIIEYLRKKDFSVLLHAFWFVPVLFLCIAGLVSGTINGNTLFVTCYGIYEYVKYFIVIFIYAAFFRDSAEFKKMYRSLLAVAVFICAAAVIEELWAVISRYILGSAFKGSIFYYKNSLLENRWRFGIYRTPSFMAHYNEFGLYSLLLLIFYKNITDRVDFRVFFLLIAGVFFSMSRTVYAGVMVFMGSQFVTRKNMLRKLIMLVPLVIAVLLMSSLPDFHVAEIISGEVLNNDTGSIPYRVYAWKKAMVVWGDHPVWGIGPGMFGGGVASTYQSYVYQEYNVFLKMGGLDMFWPQILAEMGIVGAAAYALLLILFLIAFIELRRRVVEDEIKYLFSGLAIFTVIILIYSLGNRLDVLDPIIFTFLAFAGIGVGVAGSSDPILKK